MKDEFEFTLNQEKVTTKDPLGEGYVYYAKRHPVAEDLYVVHFKMNDKWDSVNYEESDVVNKLNKQIWIIQ